MAAPDNLENKYNMYMYGDMVDDAARTEAYARALHETVKHGDTVVDIGTGPFALLARMAAHAGAGQVFAIEVDPGVADRARTFLGESPHAWSSKIEVKQGESSSVVLPVKADLVVHELIGLIAGSEGAASILRDAFVHHSKQSPGAAAGQWTVPARSRSWLVPVEIPTEEQLIEGGSPDAYRTEAFPEGRLVVSIEGFPFASCALAHPKCFEELDFASLPSDPKALIGNHTRQLTFVCDRPGVFAGFAVFITGEMTIDDVVSANVAEMDPSACRFFSDDCPAPGIGFCSAWRESHWGNLVIRLNLTSGKAVHVEPGDIIQVDADVDLTPFQPMYTFHAALRRQRGENGEPTDVLHGTLRQTQEYRSAWQLYVDKPAPPLHP